MQTIDHLPRMPLTTKEERTEAVARLRCTLTGNMDSTSHTTLLTNLLTNSKGMGVLQTNRNVDVHEQPPTEAHGADINSHVWGLLGYPVVCTCMSGKEK